MAELYMRVKRDLNPFKRWETHPCSSLESQVVRIEKNPRSNSIAASKIDIEIKISK
jgi:hypothetical protein